MSFVGGKSGATGSKRRNPSFLWIGTTQICGSHLFSRVPSKSRSTFITVESVVGQNEATARAALEAQGLTVSVVRRPNDEMAKGLVVRQDPGL